MTGGPMLPQNCGACAYLHHEGLCRRHAPSPGTEAFELVFWPRVKLIDRCGSGAAAKDGDSPGVVQCKTCIHWFQPKGVGIKPDYRQGRSVEWWASSGYCTRFAPAPSAEPDRRTMWRCVHADDGCGDGQAIEQGEAVDAGDLTPTDTDRSPDLAREQATPLPALPR